MKRELKRMTVKKMTTKIILKEAHETIAMIKAMGIRAAKEEVSKKVLEAFLVEYAQEKYDARYM
jgi:hypothetical protein